MKPTDKVAILTGAGSGIGRATAIDHTSADWSEILRVNLIGPFLMIREAGRATLAQTAFFLASDASNDINGQAIVVDVGLSASLPVMRQETGKTAA